VSFNTDLESHHVSVEQVEPMSLPLVNRFYKRCRYSAKAGRGETVFVIKVDGTIAGAVRLTPKSDNYFFLRSMCIDPEWRRQGLGKQLLAGITPFLDGINCYCYPFSHLLAFYGEVGFVHIDAEDVPAWIQQPYQRYCQQGRDIKIMIRMASGA
jgi:N-acetylglutamate synthase-like GNAT family acetyltransferase